MKNIKEKIKYLITQANAFIFNTLKRYLCFVEREREIHSAAATHVIQKGKRVIIETCESH